MSQILKTTSVGSFPKPPELMEARIRFRKGDITRDQLSAAEREATKAVIRLQEDLGLDILVHGEMERGDMVAYFAETWQGFEESLPVRSYGNRYYRKPIVVGRVGAKRGLTVEAWKEAQALTAKPMKGMLTGPYTICDWSFNAFYPDRRSLVLDLAEIVHQEALALEEAGAEYIQIDEPAISTRPEELELAIEAMAVVTTGLNTHTISHICYGDFDTIYPKLLDLPVDQLDLEVANQGFQLLDLIAAHPWPKQKELALGVVDVHSHGLESIASVKEGIYKALETVPADRLYIDPDCGLKTRTWEEAEAKLRLMMEAVREVRQELGSE
ncbi:MAG: methionine synthase [Firmicutes bacterium]|jgi:5-methyltetrahydropteroyltriglutamate--homocysteine methyltransferase|nr:methionine synthase [Bacillota bacterium]MCL5064502.1 methionine synthase [Bacillota bacterium]